MLPGVALAKYHVGSFVYIPVIFQIILIMKYTGWDLTVQVRYSHEAEDHW